MRIVLVALGLVVLLAVGWVLKGLMSDRDERDFAVHYSWIVKWALTLSRETQRAPAGASYDSPRIEVAGHPNRWVVSGNVNWRDALGSPVSEPYTAVVENTCKAYADPDCWRLEGFAMGEPAIDLAESTLAGSAPQVAQADAASDAAAPATADGADVPQQQAAAVPPPSNEPDPVLGLLNETAPATSDGAVPDAPPLPEVAGGLPLPERKPSPPSRVAAEDVGFALADTAQLATDEDSLAAIDESSRPTATEADSAAALADAGELLSDADTVAALAQTDETEAAEAVAAATAVQASPAPAAESTGETEVALTEPAAEPAPPSQAPAPQAPVAAAPTPQPAPVVVPAPQAAPVVVPNPEPAPVIAATPQPPVAVAPTPQPAPVPPKPAPTTTTASPAPAQPTPPAPAPAAPAAPPAETEIAAVPPSPPATESEPQPAPPPVVAALPPQPAPGLQPGIDPALVVLIQDRLDRAGYDPGPVDGRFGGRTQSALREFEQDAGLPVTGQPNRTALAALDRLLASRSASAPPPAAKPQLAALPPAQTQAPAPTPPAEPSAPAVLAPAPSAPPPAPATATVAPTPVRTPAKPTNLIQPAPGASQPGADESLIFLIQHRLRQAGFSPGRFDGRLSEGTTNAIRAYQGRSGLPVDGVPSRALLEQLEADVLGGEQRQPLAPTPLGYIPCEVGSGVGCAVPPA
jgi:peptidoglycan hydrolase-like protein with peptidoglycan-binding domain